MQFLFPGIWWALAALSIPVIIHLFRFKRFKIFHFSQVRWLQNLSEKQKSSRRLKHILILTSRLLALFFLIAAFAQPFFSSDDARVIKTDKNVLIFLDNTQSMMGGSGDMTAWASSVDGVNSLIRAHTADYRFVLLTHDDNPASYELIDQNEALLTLQEIRLTYGSLTWSEVNEKLRTAMVDHHFSETYVFSDFQSDGSERIEDWPENTKLIQWNARQLPDNISVDTLYFKQPPTRIGQTLEVVVKVTNRGGSEARDVLVELLLEGEARDGLRIDLSANETQTITLTTILRKGGWHSGEVKIDDFPITFDDALYFSFELREKIPVVLVTGETGKKHLENIFSDEVFSLRTYSPGNIQLSELRNAAAVVWNAVGDVPDGVAEALVASGSRLFLVMPGQVSPGFMNLLDRLGITHPENRREHAGGYALSKIVWDDPLFYGVFERKELQPEMPVVRSSWLFSPNLANPILTFGDGRPFLFRQNSISGNEVFVMTTDLHPDNSNFATHALMVPVFHNFALYARGVQQLYRILGNDRMVSYPTNDGEDYISVDIEGEGKYIPAQRRMGSMFQVRWEDKPDRPGNYDLRSGDLYIGIVSVNADRKESVFPRWKPEEVKDYFGVSPMEFSLDTAADVLVAEVMQSQGRNPIWWFALLLAAVFLCIELLLIRFLP